VPAQGGTAPVDTPPATPPNPSAAIDGARHPGYCAALRDISCWVAAVAMQPRMDASTLAALNVEIERLSRREPRETQRYSTTGQREA
jgi:hypothetical protein